MSRLLLEVCVDSIESARAAARGGADRLELCGPLSAGGTTPSLGFVEQCLEATGLPAMVMIRAHSGGFVYSDDDLAAMLADVEHVRRIGAHGVVFGALTPSRTVNREQCLRVLDASGDLQTTFHRAFDVAENPLIAFDALVEMGFDRLLTSGQAGTAIAGSPLIGGLCERSGNRVKIVAGSGVTPDNVSRLVNDTGVRELHASLSVASSGQSQGDVHFGQGRRVTCEALVRDMRNALDATAAPNG